MTKDVLTIKGYVCIWKLWKAIICHAGCGHFTDFFKLRTGFVRIGRIGRHQSRVKVLQDRRKLWIGGDLVGQVHIITALDKRAQPLTVGHDHLIFLLARSQRGGNPLVKTWPWDEIHVQRRGVPGRRCVALVKMLFHEPGWRPIRCGHGNGDICGQNRRDAHSSCKHRYGNYTFDNFT